MNTVQPKAVGFVDDQLDYLDLIEQKAAQRGISVRVTCHAEECIGWVERGEIVELVADLRMPSMGGLDIFDRVRILGEVRMTILTGFKPTKEEWSRARDLNVSIHAKQQLPTLLDLVTARTGSVEASEDRLPPPGLGAAMVVDEARNLLTTYLKGMSGRDETALFANGRAYSVNDLIREIEIQSPIGEEHLSVFLQVMRRSM